MKNEVIDQEGRHTPDPEQLREETPTKKRRRHDEETKRRAIEMVNRGIKYEIVAKTLGVSYGTITTWVYTDRKKAVTATEVKRAAAPMQEKKERVTGSTCAGTEAPTTAAVKLQSKNGGGYGRQVRAYYLCHTGRQKGMGGISRGYAPNTSDFCGA